MKQIVVYSRSGRPGPDALIQGARAAGLRVVQQRPIFSPRDGLIANVAAVFTDGLRGDCEKVRDAYRDADVPVYIVDLPRLRAAVGPDESANAVGLFLYGPCDLPHRAANTVVVYGVIADRTPELILVCGQKPGDAQLGMNDAQHAAWVRETVERCRAIFPMQTIVYRPHPRVEHNPDELYGADGLSLPAEHDLRYVLARAAVVVTYNSTAGIEAIDAGVPVAFTADPMKVCYRDYAATLGSPVRELSAEERETFLKRVGASQWTLEQLRDGTVARCLFLGQPYPAAHLITLGDDDNAGGVPGLTPSCVCKFISGDNPDCPVHPTFDGPAPGDDGAVIEEPTKELVSEPDAELPPVTQLADVLARISDGNIVLAMQAKDARKTAQPLYEARLTELTAPGT